MSDNELNQNYKNQLNHLQTENKRLATENHKLLKTLAVVNKQYSKLNKKYNNLESSHLGAINNIADKDKLLGEYNNIIYKTEPNNIIKTKYGLVATYNEDNDSVVQLLKKHGEYQTHIIDIFKQYVKPNSIIIDVGANIGFFTMVYSKLMPSCHIHSFEMMPKTHKALVKTVKTNKLKNVTCHNIGLFDKDTIVNVGYKPYMLGHSFIHDDQNRDGTKAMCTILDKYNFKNVSFIKIDIQGAEYEALLGAKQTLIDNDCIVLAEFTRDKTLLQNNKIKYNDTCKFMESIGYKMIKKKRKEYIFKKVINENIDEEIDEKSQM
jgi:FkbM family methyltransferase